MFLNILRLTPPGGGPAPLIKNKAIRQCYGLMFLNMIITIWSIFSILYSKFLNSHFGTEISAYLSVVFIMGSISSYFFSKLGSRKYSSDVEWSKILILILIINLIQYGAIVWGCWILYKVFMSRHLIGTKMYYYFIFSRWMYSTLFCLTALYSFSVILTSLTYSQLLISLVNQRIS
ncbi:hypothetical protein cand_038390 [Cryptosporidium andersoni]|uniref:Transmembrane protein n=1 Tax=Cryptosporidium andersoni TaxID=117008 RepID=A0A1J4MWM0_9CRYT|nr:hypothetical protein cand_038390 [Cryptosporidium andersoni]